MLLQYPGTTGAVRDDRELVAHLHAQDTLVAVAADLLALVLLTPPGEWGADVVVGLGAALRRADGLRRPARRVLRHPRGVQAQPARPPGRRVGRLAGSPRAAPRAADARAAHPAREGHQQHLHRAGAAGEHRRHVRGVPRSRRPARDRASGCTGSRVRSPTACARWVRRAPRVRSSTPSRVARPRERRRARGGGARRARQPARGRRRTRSASRSTRPRPPTRCTACWRAFGVDDAASDLRTTIEAALPNALRRTSDILTHPVFRRTTPSRRCCATCASCPTATSRSTAR